MKTIRFDRDYLIVLNRGLDFRLKTNLAVRFGLLKKNLQRTISQKSGLSLFIMQNGRTSWLKDGSY